MQHFSNYSNKHPNRHAHSEREEDLDAGHARGMRACERMGSAPVYGRNRGLERNGQGTLDSKGFDLL